MLALTDAALARLCIACTRVRPTERGQWLQRIAERVDPGRSQRGVEIVSSQAYAWGSRRLLMKLTPIAIGLFAITGQASLAFARGGLHLLDPPLNPQHINGLPSEVRSALAHKCRGAQAQHQFAVYSQNSRALVLHFEHLHCSDPGAFCRQAGCLHQVYVSADGRYRLLRSYYAPKGD
jgi:hypothetical protein